MSGGWFDDPIANALMAAHNTQLYRRFDGAWFWSDTEGVPHIIDQDTVKQLENQNAGLLTVIRDDGADQFYQPTGAGYGYLWQAQK